VTDNTSLSPGSNQRPQGKLVVPLKKAAEKGAPYFVVSGLGGHVIPFQIVDKYVNEGWEGFGILYPGFVDGLSCGETPSIEGYAELMLEEVLSVQPSGPYFLVGYSMGGPVCLEMAHLLEARGEKVGVVLIDVKINKEAKRKKTLFWIPFWLKWKIIDYFQKMTVRGEKLAEQRRKQAMLYHGTEEPDKIPESLSRVVRDGKIATENYNPKRYGVPSVLIRCKNMAWHDQAHDWFPDYGWGKYVSMLAVLFSPGNHITMIKPPNAVHFAEKLKQALSILQNGK